VKTPILGQAYVARSVNAADNRMINLYPEAVPEEGKESSFLTRAPGLRLVATVGSGPIRGMWTFGSYGYIASGFELYRVDSLWNQVLIGAITGTGPVSMSDNGTQLFVACNPDGYIYNASTTAFAQITDPDFPGAVTVGYLDEYFVFNEPDSQKIWITSLLDGTAVDPLDFASAEGSPDALTALNINHREAWLFGPNSIEVWYNADTPDFPLARIQGAFLELGCDAPYSIAKLDNSIFWLGGDARGRGIVYRADGYTGKRVSTHAVEFAIQNYSAIDDAIGYSYQQEGHSFYVLSFPTDGKTWAYDVATNKWHERAALASGLLTRHRSNCQMKFADEVLVGDYVDGRVYAFDLDVYADDGTISKWLRSWRALGPGQNNLKRTAHHSLQLDCESGVGLIVGAQGEDPQVNLRWSDDGGHTWSSYHARSMGEIGVTGYRVIWRRLGMTTKLRDRVYEVSGTDPVKIQIMGAELFASGTNA